jgi:hypothetical protein
MKKNSQDEGREIGDSEEKLKNYYQSLYKGDINYWI